MVNEKDLEKYKKVAELVAETHGYVFPSGDKEFDDSAMCCANRILEAIQQADDTRWREKIEGVFKEIEQSLDICEDELGFCSISNHVPFSEYQNLESRILKDK